MGRSANSVWCCYTAIAARGSAKKHPDVKCNFCGKRINNVQQKKNHAPHLRRCGDVPADELHAHAGIRPRSVVENQYVIQATFGDEEPLKRHRMIRKSAKLDKVRAILSDHSLWCRAKRVLNLVGPINKNSAICESDRTCIFVAYSEFNSLRQNDACVKPISCMDNEESAACLRIQHEVPTLIETHRKFVLTKLMRAGFLLDHTTSICDFDKDDLAITKDEARQMANTDLMDESAQSKLLEELTRWSRLKHLWQDSQYSANSLNLHPSTFWLFNHDFIHSKRRKRLKPARVEKLVFVYSNIHTAPDESRPDHADDDMIPGAHDADMVSSEPETTGASDSESKRQSVEAMVSD
ncbi:hypothetical protein FI667_g10188, partial [Globisporangium splendens]